MKIQDIKNALNTKVSTLNVQASQPTTPTPAPKAKVSPATVVNSRTEEKPVKKESGQKAKTNKVNEVVTTKDVATDNIDVVVAKLLKPNMDYGMIPGCKKPSLLKAGAEKLAVYYGFSTSISIENRFENYDKKLVAYEVKATVYDTSGKIIAEGIGAANSQERKFLKGDFFSQINTVLKIAKKRAYVDAIITGTGCSSIFTQDLEEISLQANQEQEAI